MQRIFSADMTAKRYNNVNLTVEKSRWRPLNFSGPGLKTAGDASKQRARNVPLASADVRGGGVACVAAGRFTKSPVYRRFRLSATQPRGRKIA